MNQAILSVRVNANDKKEFEEFCSKTGMNISTAINMFIKNVVREQRLPFQVKVPQEIIDKIEEAEEDYKKNPRLYSAEEVYDSIRKMLDN